MNCCLEEHQMFLIFRCLVVVHGKSEDLVHPALEWSVPVN